jgi:hypothetical protein
MLKHLAILAIAAFVTVSVSSQPNKTPNPNQQPGHTEQAVVVKSTPEKQNESATGQPKTNPDPPKWYASLERPDWWLVIVGFGTLAVVGWQTKILGDSVAVAKKSAETTSQQVELYANAERARITIDITDSGRSFRIRGKNTGKAVAQVKRASGYTLVLPHGKPLPPIPPYLSEPETLGDFVESVPPNEFIVPMDSNGYNFMIDLSDLDLCAAIRDKQKVLWAYGRILYIDGISPHLRETRFCYEATVDENMETNIDMSGPGVYRLET